MWDDYKEYIWNLVNAHRGELLFDDLHYEAEIYTLLEKNIHKFTPAEKENLKEIIEKGPQRYVPEENKEIFISYWKQKWYSAVKDDVYFEPMYMEMRNFTNVEEELNFEETEVRWGPGDSPLTKEAILQMSNIDLAEFLSTFKTGDPWRGPTVGGLSDMLQSSVKEKPEKITGELSPFLNSSYLYVYDILIGIRDAWNNKKSIEWGNTFDFISQYIKCNEFWQDQYRIDDYWKANHKLVVGIIGELIQEGTKDDNRAFPEEHFPKAQGIIFYLIDNLKIEHENKIGDSVTYALNSPFGKIITALIYLALRIAKLEDKKNEKKEVKWSVDFKDRFKDTFSRGVLEAYTLFGQYMPQLYYLDKSWVENQIKELIVIQNDTHWEYFVDGYLYAKSVYNNLYILMRQHYEKALSYSFKESNIEERLVNHIAIGCLRGIEDTHKEPLYSILLNKWQPSQIMVLISFFLMQRDFLLKAEKDDEGSGDIEQKGEFIKKIIAFWEYAYEKYKDTPPSRLEEDDKRILALISRLSVFLPELNDKYFDWLMLSAPNLHFEFNSPFVIEYLDILKDKGDKIQSAKYIGKIFLKMLDSFTPDFDKKHIRSIVEFMYECKNDEIKKLADDICNRHVHGNLFLRDLYERYQPKITNLD